MKYFKEAEFDCHCRRGLACRAVPMQPAFLAKLDKLREKWGKPLKPTSARRCPDYNKRIGGVPRSQHLFGNACDFYFADQGEATEFVNAAEGVGFLGIGHGVRLVHIDNRKTYARWTYSI